MTNISNHFEEHTQVMRAVSESTEIQAGLVSAVSLCVAAIKNGRKLLFCGNGGSASDSQHLATELTIRFIADRPAIAAIALTTDTSALTAAGNDIGFDRVFSRQIEALGNDGDILLAFSTSGNSVNIVRAVKEAHSRGMKVIFFGGGTGGQLLKQCDVSLVVPSKTTARIQEMHILFGHILCGGIETGLGYAA